MKQLVAFVVLIAAPALFAGTSREVDIRVYLHDPVQAGRVLKIKDKAGTLGKLDLRSEGLAPVSKAFLENGELVIHQEDGTIAGRSTLTAGIESAVVILTPSGKEISPPCRMVVLDDSTSAFPWGQSKVISLLGVETAVQAGEHKLSLPSGKVTSIPEVKKVDEFNMAQANFFYREGGAWVPFTERRMQFTGEIRRIFLVHATPGSQQPFVATLLDYKPVAGP